MLTTNPTREIRTAITTLIEATQHINQALNELYANQPGYPTATGGGQPPQLTDAGTPTGLEKHLRPDPAHDDYLELIQHITQVKAAATRIHTIVSIWTAEATTEGSPRNTPGDCITCGTTVTKPQRIRAGLCEPCYRHWTRARHHNPTLERHTWIQQRRSSLTGDMVTTHEPNGSNDKSDQPTEI